MVRVCARSVGVSTGSDPRPDAVSAPFTTPSPNRRDTFDSTPPPAATLAAIEPLGFGTNPDILYVAAPNGDKRALKETESASLWECFWNSDMRVEWAQLHSAIERAVRDASGTAVPKRGRRREG